MPEREPIVELNEGYSEPDAKAPAWAQVQALLAETEMFWLSTMRRDGRPHVTPLPAVWADGRLHFCVGSQEQKARNLEANPRCVLTAGPNQLGSGLDVAVEGTAVRVADQAGLKRLAEAWQAKLNWPFTVTDGGFIDSAGRFGIVYGVEAAKILSFSKSPVAQTRYRFSG